MLIIIGLISLLAIGICMLVFDRLNKYSFDWFKIAGVIITIFAGTILFLSIITIPIHRIGNKALIQQFNITKTTYENSRKNLLNIENAAIQVDIAEQNRWLINAQYWNNTIFDVWIPDEIMDLKPLR